MLLIAFEICFSPERIIPRSTSGQNNFLFYSVLSVREIEW